MNYKRKIFSKKTKPNISHELDFISIIFITAKRYSYVLITILKAKNWTSNYSYVFTIVMKT